MVREMEKVGFMVDYEVDEGGKYRGLSLDGRLAVVRSV